MIRIAGVDLPENKKIEFALQSIYGVGPKIAGQILQEANVDPNKRRHQLNNDEINRIQRGLDRYPVEGDLRRTINDHIERLKRIRAYRGIRHMQKLPVRGQRTRTNSRNARGGVRRRTVGALSKEMAQKLEESAGK